MVGKVFTSLFAALGLMAAVPGGQAAAAESVTTVEVVRQLNQIVLGGTVIPSRQVSIAAQLPGRVKFIAGVEGDAFEQHTVLIALNDDELLAQRRSALAAMSNAEASLRNAGVQFQRELTSPSSRNSMSGMGVPGMFDQMFTRNFSDMMGINNPGMERQADLYSRSTGIEQARSAFMQARSQLEQVDAKLRDAVGYAPFNGVIVKKLVEVGDTVQPGQPLLAYADTEALQVLVEVPARLMPGVRDGDELEARLDIDSHTPVKVRVAQIFPMADPIRHTVTVKLDIPLDSRAAPGMYAEVMIPDVSTPAMNLPVISRAAIVHRGSLPAVYVLSPLGKRELRVLRLGRPVGDDRVAVLAGLSGGERVVNNPLKATQ
ncbi:MAG: efflux RND transporter periplasmic adaptor subunit [Gammaproteobacteria bacterium]|nr:efflux RND transporter periplasmic adaptor subunit [Gammaproteobacteria bacterium]